MNTPNGVVLYHGPSELDGEPIVVIATGLVRGSTNAKTGAMVQTFILRADASPVDAVRSGDDVSICGTCPHRGTDGFRGRSCYVNVAQAPQTVWKAWRRGIYPTVSPEQARDILSGRVVRLGAYGDPAAIPLRLVEMWLARARAWNGYTHQWRDIDPAWSRYTMASADSVTDRFTARALGYRTFRVLAHGEGLGDREIVCPSDRGVSCVDCRACGGTAAKARVDIAIFVHGTKGHVNAFHEKAAA